MENLEWPGWLLKNNKHGKEFDLPARKRMIEGGEKLIPLIKKYKEKIGENVLEIGPFFTPIIKPEDFPKLKVTYWDNDINVIRNFKNRKNVKIKKVDLKNLENIEEKQRFDSIVVSQILNYLDYKKFLKKIKPVLKTNGLIFINNVVDYGLPKFFSDRRPKSISETLKVLEQLNYKVLEKKIGESPNTAFQKNKRLILVAKNL